MSKLYTLSSIITIVPLRSTSAKSTVASSLLHAEHELISLFKAGESRSKNGDFTVYVKDGDIDQFMIETYLLIDTWGTRLPNMKLDIRIRVRDMLTNDLGHPLLDPLSPIAIEKRIETMHQLKL